MLLIIICVWGRIKLKRISKYRKQAKPKTAIQLFLLDRNLHEKNACEGTLSKYSSVTMHPLFLISTWSVFSKKRTAEDIQSRYFSIAFRGFRMTSQN